MSAQKPSQPILPVVEFHGPGLTFLVFDCDPEPGRSHYRAPFRSVSLRLISFRDLPPREGRQELAAFLRLSRASFQWQT
jgi:hypothetical protein